MPPATSPSSIHHIRARALTSSDPALATRNDPRSWWVNAFRCVRGETERRAAPLGPEDQGLQSMPDASPAKWHRAHTTWFFEQFILRPFLPDYRPFDPAFRYLFNSYYEAVGDRHPRPMRGLLSRPSADVISAYRAHVDAAISRLPDRLSAEIQDRLELGSQHEEQHQELLVVDTLH